MILLDLPQKLRAGGNYKQAAELEKQITEHQNLLRESAIKKHDAMTIAFGDISQNPTQYKQILEHHAQNGLLDPNDANEIGNRLSTLSTPEEIADAANKGSILAKDVSAAKAKELYHKPETTSSVGKLMQERDTLPQNDPRRAIYDAAIKKETEKPDNTSIAVIGPDGKTPILVTKATATSAGMQPYIKSPSAGGINENSPTYKAGLAELKRDEASVQSASEMEGAYNRWKQLNATQNTGPIAGRNPANMFNTDYQSMGTLENFFSMNNFKSGQGAMSNAERAYIKGAGPQRTNNKETNDSIIAVKLGALENQKDMYNFKEYTLQTKGSLLGANKQWQDYIEKNPRYTIDKKGTIVPNENRQTWEEYFQGGAQANEPAKNTPTITKTKSGATTSGW